MLSYGALQAFDDTISIADDGFLGPEQPVITPDDQFKVSPADTNKKKKFLEDFSESSPPDSFLGSENGGDFSFEEALPIIENKAFESV